MNIKVLNEIEPNVLAYLPYGITTLEMKLEPEGDNVDGFIHPVNVADQTKKIYAGYADESQDFLVLWGGGYERGLHVNKENNNGRLFLQVLHRGLDLDCQSLSLCFNDIENPIGKIRLVPALDSTNLVSMKLVKDRVSKGAEIAFEGNRMPSYYSRWFPPRILEKDQRLYHNIEAPPKVTIKFEYKEASDIPDINSDIEILLDGNRIAQIVGDWKYSWPHAEFFTIFGDSRYFIMRLWLYWIKAEFSNSFFKDFNNGIARTPRNTNGSKSEDKGIRNKNILETLDIECPDIERFDFLINMKKRKITWIGTDFHYQELWYKIEESEPVLKVGIALPGETIEQVFLRLQNRFDQPKKSYDPMTLLRKFLEKPEFKGTLIEGLKIDGETCLDNQRDKSNIANKGVGFTRKHIPYVENGRVVKELISSVVTS